MVGGSYRYITCESCQHRIYLSSDNWTLDGGKFYCLEGKCQEMMKNRKVKNG